MNIAHALASDISPRSLGSRFRRKRAGHLRQIIDSCYEKTGGCSIIDVGGREKYWRNIIGNEFLRSRNCHVTLVNTKRPKRINNQDSLYEYVQGDGCNLADVPTSSFDIAHSNSVIEHVGHWKRREAFAREIRRTGRRYFIQTPYFWFPWEPHLGVPFFHWLPQSWRLAILVRFRLGYHTEVGDIGDAMAADEGRQLLDRKMFRYLFPDAKILNEKVLFLTTSLIAGQRS